MLHYEDTGLPVTATEEQITCDIRNHEDGWLRLHHTAKLYYTVPSSQSTWLDFERAWVRWNTSGRTARQNTIIWHTVRIWESFPRYVTELIHKQRVYLVPGRLPIRWLEVSQSVKWLLTGWTNRASILDKGMDISLHYHVHTGSGAHAALSYPVGTGGSFQRAKATGEVNQISPSSSVLTQSDQCSQISFGHGALSHLLTILRTP